MPFYPGQTDLVLLVVVIEDIEGIAIRNLDDLAGEGIGQGWYEEKYQEKRNYTDCHSLSLESWI